SLDVGHQFTRPERHGEMVGHRQCGAGSLLPHGAVFDVAGQRALTAVSIDRRYPGTALQQGDDDVHRRCRLARPALLIAEDNDMGRARRSRLTLHNFPPLADSVPTGTSSNQFRSGLTTKQPHRRSIRSRILSRIWISVAADV